MTRRSRQPAGPSDWRPGVRSSDLAECNRGGAETQRRAWALLVSSTRPYPLSRRRLGGIEVDRWEVGGVGEEEAVRSCRRHEKECYADCWIVVFGVEREQLATGRGG